MKKEETLAMKAGNQLNAEVASQIMGIKVEYPFGEGFPYYLKEDDKWRKGVPWAEQGKMKWAPISPYSTDISATWPILKKLREEYWCIEIKIADGCRVIMELLRTPPIRVEVNAGTPFERLPEAICKAALLAKYSTKNTE